MEAVIYYAETDGISLERMVRRGSHSMHVRHFHNQYEIFYLLEGERRFFFDNRSYLVKGGTLILVDENAIHMTMANSDEESVHDRIILYIDKEKMQELDQMFPNLNLVKFLHQNYGVFPLSTGQQQDFLGLYASLQREFDGKNRSYKAMIDMQILMYFIRFMRENHVPAIQDSGDEDTGSRDSGDKDSSRYQTIYDVADYISEHFDSSLTLDGLAGQFYISKYHLSRTFKEVTGYGINEFINIHRIRRAKRLLEETDMSISEIASSLGYGSISYFEKIFKTYMAISPLKYRKTPDTVRDGGKNR